MVALGMLIVEANDSIGSLSIWYCIFVLALVYHSNLPFYALILFLQTLLPPPWLQMQ
jgi:hypothetical protein